MAGNANSGRRRRPIPTGKEAEEELRRIRRNERRRARAAKKRAAAAGEEYVPEDESNMDLATPPPGAVDGPLTPPTEEELKADLMYAFNELGGRAGLVAWGRRYPKEFYALWTKHCLPKESEGKEESGGLEGLLSQLEKRKSKETVQ